MKLRNNRGVTGVDISVSIVIVSLFIGIIATLAYNFSISSKAISRKSEALNLAIQTIEQLKNTPYDNLQPTSPNGQTVTSGSYDVNTVITKYVDSQYTDGMSSAEKAKIADVIKIVKVNVSYTVKTETQNVEISTVITKGD